MNSQPNWGSLDSSDYFKAGEPPYKAQLVIMFTLNILHLITRKGFFRKRYLRFFLIGPHTFLSSTYETSTILWQYLNMHEMSLHTEFQLPFMFGTWDITHQISKSRHDLDLDRTLPNVKLVRAIFICYHVLKFQAQGQIWGGHHAKAPLIFTCRNVLEP